MPPAEIDVSFVTPAGIERVLRYLPAFVEPNRRFGDVVSAKLVGPREFEICGGGLGDVEQSFVEACYSENLVQSFDWMAWVEENPDIAGSSEFIRGADLRAIIMLLTTHIRGDRFSSGHLVNVFCDGLIVEILLRLSQLHSSDTNDLRGRIWRTAANDRHVLAEHIRFEEGDASLTVKVREVSWRLPYDPVSTWVDAAVIPAGRSDRARDFAVQRVLNSARYFQICTECGERHPIGHIISDLSEARNDVCHGCAQGHGVVF